VKRSSAFAVIAAAIVAFVPVSASAQGEDEPAKKSGVEWNEAWPKFRWWEYGLTTVSWGATIASGYVLPDTPYGWQGRNGFDETIRDELRWSSNSARLGAASVSDAMFYGLAAYPIVVDGLIVTAGIHKKPDVAYQMIMTDIEALGVAGLGSTITERTGRERPYVRTCPKPGGEGTTSEPAGAFSVEAPCEDTGRNQSFVSGHTAAAFAGAGLICVNHDVFRLYGARAADITVCALGMGTAGVAAYLRVASDVHYATDVLGATAIGLGSGLLLPYLLRYGSGNTPGRQRFGVGPLGGKDTVGLTVHGALF
jgi:membrane-associated phospholipid phosphatase